VSFIRWGLAFRWLGVYLFSPQVLHVTLPFLTLALSHA
jgi:hypothetical protein